MAYTSPKYTYVSNAPAFQRLQDDLSASVVAGKERARTAEEERLKELKENEKANDDLLRFGRAQNMAFNKKWWEKNQYDNPNAESVAKKFFSGTGKEYADLAMKINSGDCESDNCETEMAQLQVLEGYPEATADFIGDLNSEFSKIGGRDYDKNQESDYTLASKIFNGEPGFTSKDGYKVDMLRNDDGTIEMVFEGPGFKDGKLSINNNTLGSTLDAEGEMIHTVPKMSTLENELLSDSGIFGEDMIDENGIVLPTATLGEDFIVMGPDGRPEYEVITSSDGMYQQNVLKWDENKFNNKMKLYLDTQLETMQETPSDMIGLWNVRLSPGAKSYDEDLARAALGLPDAEADVVKKAWGESKFSQIVQEPWSYDDIPLSDEKKALFAAVYASKMKETFKKRFMPQIVAPGLDGQVSYTEKALAALNTNTNKGFTNPGKGSWNTGGQ